MRASVPSSWPLSRPEEAAEGMVSSLTIATTLPAVGSPCFTQENGDRNKQYRDHTISWENACKQRKEHLIHFVSRDLGKIPKYLEEQVLALIGSYLYLSKHGRKSNLFSDPVITNRYFAYPVVQIARMAKKSSKF
jgi:hypothetical protein